MSRCGSRKHEAVALVGRNGAGKSTTLKSLMGIVARRSGSIKFDGSELVAQKAHSIARLGMQLVHENRRIFGKPQRGREHHSRRLTAEAKWRSSAFTGCSPGLRNAARAVALIFPEAEQQMLAIARALCAIRKIILLDEPFEGLAPIIVQDLVHTCRELARSGQTIVLVEQNLAATLALAERVYILNNGHIIHEGPALELKAQPGLLQRYLGV